jgi:hypothetical protein
LCKIKDERIPEQCKMVDDKMEKDLGRNGGEYANVEHI